MKLSEKSLRCPKRGLRRHRRGVVRPDLAREYGRIHPPSVIPTPFQTVSQRSSKKFGRSSCASIVAVAPSWGVFSAYHSLVFHEPAQPILRVGLDISLAV